MRRFLLILLLLITIQPISAQTDFAGLMAQGNAAYEAGDYVSAISIFQNLVDSGVVDGTLYYNLGNAYYTVGDLGHAMLNYHRAQEIMPRDGDLNLNIARVRTRRVDIQGDESGLTESFAAITSGIMTMGELGVLVFILWGGVFAGIVAYILKVDLRERLRVPLMVAGGVLIVGLLLLGSRLFIASSRPTAIMIAPITSVMSGPGEDYLEHFRIYAGAEVRILESRNGWMRFLLPDGQQGWIPESSAEVV